MRPRPDAIQIAGNSQSVEYLVIDRLEKMSTED